MHLAEQGDGLRREDLDLDLELDIDVVVLFEHLFEGGGYFGRRHARHRDRSEQREGNRPRRFDRELSGYFFLLESFDIDHVADPNPISTSRGGLFLCPGGGREQEEEKWDGTV